MIRVSNHWLLVHWYFLSYNVQFVSYFALKAYKPASLALLFCHIQAVTSSSTSLSSFEVSASTEISAWELLSGFLLARWHKRPHEALKEQSSICQGYKVHERLVNPLAVEVDKFLLPSHVWKKILTRASDLDEQQLKKARCEGGSFVSPCSGSERWRGSRGSLTPPSHSLCPQRNLNSRSTAVSLPSLSLSRLSPLGRTINSTGWRIIPTSFWRSSLMEQPNM